jgi:hypothetical protein
MLLRGLAPEVVAYDSTGLIEGQVVSQQAPARPMQVAVHSAIENCLFLGNSALLTLCIRGLTTSLPPFHN